MSYSSELKTQLIEKSVRKNCCCRAMLCGMMAFSACTEDDVVKIPLPSGAVSDFAIQNIRTQYGRNTESGAYGVGKKQILLSFESAAAASYVKKAQHFPITPPVCNQCRLYFLRGIFLAAGRVSDYGGHLRLEFSCKRGKEELFSLLSAVSENVLYTERGNEKLFYFKAAASVGDFFAAIGAANITYDLINHTIEAQYRNDANRRANCETKNIGRSVEAGARFVHLYRLLEAEGKLGVLPPDLAEAAKLRIENPDLSLSALAALCVPPVTKSGMKHRLAKIEEMAETLCKKSREEDDGHE